MSYLRPVKHEELVAWLESNAVGCCGEEVTLEQLAARLIETFDLIKEFKTL